MRRDSARGDVDAAARARRPGWPPSSANGQVPNGGLSPLGDPRLRAELRTRRRLLRPARRTSRGRRGCRCSRRLPSSRPSRFGGLHLGRWPRVRRASRSATTGSGCSRLSGFAPPGLRLHGIGGGRRRLLLDQQARVDALGHFLDRPPSDRESAGRSSGRPGPGRGSGPEGDRKQRLRRKRWSSSPPRDPRHDGGRDFGVGARVLALDHPLELARSSSFALELDQDPLRGPSRPRPPGSDALRAGSRAAPRSRRRAGRSSSTCRDGRCRRADPCVAVELGRVWPQKRCPAPSSLQLLECRRRCFLESGELRAFGGASASSSDVDSRAARASRSLELRPAHDRARRGARSNRPVFDFVDHGVDSCR